MRPHAPVEPVQFKYMAEVIQQKINAETEVAHRSAFGEDASKKEPTPDFLSDFRRYGVAQQYKLQQKRLEQQASIRGDYFSGIIGRRNTSFKGRSSSVSEPGNASVVSRELQLNRSYKEDEENAIMERFKEIELEREIFYREKASQQEMEAKSGYSALVRDDPLLQAHTTNDSLMKSKPRENNQILQVCIQIL